jgi:ethanolamine utilization protein EutA
MLDHLEIAVGPGHCLTPRQLDAILGWQLELIEHALVADRSAFQNPVARLHEQVIFNSPGELIEPIYCLSGGVGELVYDILQAKPLPAKTQFGDLGIDLAHRLATSPGWTARLTGITPQHAGRATVYGLLLRATQVSGSTVFLPDPALLPLRDVPIFGRVSSDSTDEQIRDILQLVARSAAGGCVVVSLAHCDRLAVRSLGERIGSAQKTNPFDVPLVLLVSVNVGKALGGYVSQWGSNAVKLIVLDEIEPLDARFVQIGTLRDQVVPLSFYGLN